MSKKHKEKIQYIQAPAPSYQSFPSQQRQDKKVELIPKNTAQEEYVGFLNDIHTRITIAMGPAGTGKTFLAVLKAIKDLKERRISRIVVTRPAVSVDEKHGFLPGDLNQKMEPWLIPILDVFEEFYTQEEIRNMMFEKIIDVAPFGFMRGRTLKNCYIIADECQNTTPDQMKCLLTRLGTGSKLAITGDPNQHDRGFTENGLKNFVDRLRGNTKSIKVCIFRKEHVERDPVVAEVLNIYGDD